MCKRNERHGSNVLSATGKKSLACLLKPYKERLKSSAKSDGRDTNEKKQNTRIVKSEHGSERIMVGRWQGQREQAIMFQAQQYFRNKTFSLIIFFLFFKFLPIFSPPNFSHPHQMPIRLETVAVAIFLTRVAIVMYIVREKYALQQHESVSVFLFLFRDANTATMLCLFVQGSKLFTTFCIIFPFLSNYKQYQFFCLFSVCSCDRNTFWRGFQPSAAKWGRKKKQSAYLAKGKRNTLITIVIHTAGTRALVAFCFLLGFC